MSNNKICGECKYFKQNEEICLHDKKHYWSKKEFDACTGFEAKPVTNGDVIRQMSNVELANVLAPSCEMCIYNNSNDCDFRKCEKGILPWLNAHVDCVKQNGNDDTQTYLSKADNTESEGEDE